MIHWGIIGLGNMANIFAQSINEINNCKVKAIASLNRSKSEVFSKKFNIDKKYVFNSYEELIQCEEINAVYIATLNNTHKNLITKSAENNKNILCEKPITITDDEIETVYKKIKDSKIIFLEAIAYRSHPITKTLVEILSNEKLGKVEKIFASFGFNTKRINPNSRLYKKELGGGAILDVGCYPLSALNLINKIQANKSKIMISNVSGNICETGVDDQSFANVELNNGIVAEIEVGIRKKLKNCLIIRTSNGEIKIPEIWLPNKKSYIDIRIGDHFYKKFINCDFSVYGQQINFFNSLIKNTNKIIDSYGLSLEDSKEIAKLSLEWRKKLY